jgi:DNA-directed RNA polymerase specialized sigma24 family protein
VEFDLWHFLFELLAVKNDIPNDRYIAVCIRNKFIELNRKRCKNEALLPLKIDIPSVEFDNDTRIDLREGVKHLTPREKCAIYEHFYEGKSFEEIAKETHRTRQAVRQNCVRGVLRLRDFYGCKK